MKNIIIALFLLFSSQGFAQEKTPEEKTPLFNQVILCKNQTYIQMENIQDNLKGANVFYLLENLKKDHDICLQKIVDLKALASTTQFKDALMAALIYSEKRLIVDRKVLEIFLNNESKPSEIAAAQEIIGKSRTLRQTENDYWKKLEETITALKENGGEPSKKHSDFIFWLSILFVGGSIYLLRKKKNNENNDLDESSGSKRPIYDKLNNWVERINKKADEIQKRKQNQQDEEK